MKTAIQLNTVKQRDALAPQSEVYFMPLGTGRALGYRKPTATAIGTWRARYRPNSGTAYQYQPLGKFDDVPAAGRFDAAKAAAQKWFDHLSGGGAASDITVRQACERHVAALLEQKKHSTAPGVRSFFNAFVPADSNFGRTGLRNLTPALVAEWCKRLGATPLKSGKAKGQPRGGATYNQGVTSLRAALNRAVTDKFCASNAAWARELVDKPVGNQSRKDYVERANRQALIAAAPADLAQFLEAMSRLPLRPGTLAKLKVRDFNAKASTLSIGIDDEGVLVDKAHAARAIGLTPDTRDFFARQCHGRPADAPLLVQENGKAWNKDAWKAPFRAICRHLGLPDSVVMYTLRHSTITDLCKIAPAIEVARMAGTSVAEIDKTYFQSQPAHQAEYLQTLALDKLVTEPALLDNPAELHKQLVALERQMEALRARLDALG